MNEKNKARDNYLYIEHGDELYYSQVKVSKMTHNVWKKMTRKLLKEQHPSLWAHTSVHIICSQATTKKNTHLTDYVHGS